MRPAVGVAASGASPLSSHQRRMWEYSAVRSITLAPSFVLRGAVSPEALRRALLRVVERHEVLRSRFSLQDGQPIAMVHQPELPFWVVDVEGDPDRAEAVKLSAQHAEFDLANDPPIRATLLQAVEESSLVVAMPHIVCDLPSFGVLLDDVSTFYEAETTGEGEDLAPLSVQYAEWAHRELRWLGSDEHSEALARWQRRLSAPPVLCTLPTDRPRPAIERFQGPELEVALSSGTMERVGQCSRDLRATPFMLWAAAYAAQLSLEIGSADILIAFPVGARPAPEFDPVIGCYATRSVLRCSVNPDSSFAELVRDVRGETLTAMADRLVPQDDIFRALGVEPRQDRQPLTQVRLQLDVDWGQPRVAGGVAWELAAPRAVEGEGVVRGDLTVTVQERGAGSFVVTEWASDLYRRDTVDDFTRDLVLFMREAVEQPQESLRALRLSKAGSRRRPR